MAGAPCPEVFVRQVIDEMRTGEIATAYGMTETSLVTMHTDRDGSVEHYISTIGRFPAFYTFG